MRRNKLKRNKPVQIKEADRHHVHAAVIVLSDGSCSDGESLPAAHSSFSKGLKIAPIFGAADQLRKKNGSSAGRSDQAGNTSTHPSRRGDAKSPPSGSQLAGKHGAAVASCRSSHLESHLEEIHNSNPAFPAPIVFSTLLKKAGEEPRPAEALQTLLKEKSRGPEVSLQPDPSADPEVGPCPLTGQDGKQQQPRGNGLRCSRQSRRPLGLGGSCHANRTTPDTELTKGSHRVQAESSFEDVLWTDKYAPRHSSEVIGNSASVNKLHSWLKKWKLRADADERRQMEQKQREEGTSWDRGDFQGEAGLEDGGEEPCCNAMLLTGPSGVGKTAAVYACAQELGFKVFEVNCSSRRCGRHVLSQLKEATQSHLVDTQGKDPLKPAYFNNYSVNSFTPKSEALPGKLQHPKIIASTSRKRTARNFRSSGRKFKAKPAAVTLAHYFKVKGKADYFDISDKSTTGKPKTEEVENYSAGCDEMLPHSKKTAMSLILFEEVDVVFEDDVGFLAAIKAFMTSTKRPVVMTTSDPSFKEKFDSYLEEIIFKTPSAVNICSYLQLVCLAENVRLPSDDASSLFSLACGDVRRCLLQLQLWVSGSRGGSSRGGELAEEPAGSLYSSSTGGGGLDSKFPPWQAGCSAHMLGLHPVTLDYLRNSLQPGSWSETDTTFLKILAESWRRSVPLLYSNLELLLSIAAPGSDAEPKCSDAHLHILRRNRTIGSEASPTCTKSSRLSRRRRAASASDAKSASDLTSEPQRASSLRETGSKTPSSCAKPEDCAAKAVTDCLDGLADFFDLMSNIDAMLPQYISDPRAAEAFVWTGAAVKDGLLDEPAEEDSRSGTQDRLQEIKAAAEGLGCRRCWWRVTEARTEAHRWKQKLDAKQWNSLQERLMFTTCSQRQNLSFTAQPGRTPSVFQRRFRLSRLVLCSKSFSLLGNRRAVCVDYLPVLRFICRTLGAQRLGSAWNYPSATHLGLSKSAIRLLAEDFTAMNIQKHF
ncbi:ATPase family AAA domain-containing protein 5b [Fundulus diaphanus]